MECIEETAIETRTERRLQTLRSERERERRTETNRQAQRHTGPETDRDRDRQRIILFYMTGVVLGAVLIVKMSDETD